MSNSDEIRHQKLAQWKHRLDRENVARIQGLAKEFNLSFMEASAAVQSSDMERLSHSIDNISLCESGRMTLTNFDYYMDILIDKLDG